jgi:hypothetical protein
MWDTKQKVKKKLSEVMFSNDHTMFNLYTNHLYITQGSFDLITIYHLQTSKAKNIKNFMNISNLLEPMFDNF